MLAALIYLPWPQSTVLTVLTFLSVLTFLTFDNVLNVLTTFTVLFVLNIFTILAVFSRQSSVLPPNVFLTFIPPVSCFQLDQLTDFLDRKRRKDDISHYN